MKILFLTPERNLELEREHEIMYLDFNVLDSLGPEESRKRILHFRPDLMVEREFNDSRMRYDELIDWVRANTDFPTAVWLIDTHCILKRHRKYSRKFQYVFLAISKYVDQFRKWNPCTFWLPLCYPERSDAIMANDGPKQYDITFIGNYLRKEQHLRKKMLEIVRKEFGDRLFVKTDYANMHQLIASSRISFNCSTAQDLNFRIWEVLANGVELVTDVVPDIYKIPGLAGRIHMYDNKKEMLRRIHALLDGSAQKDPAEARDWVKRNHCMIHRHRAMLHMIETNTQSDF